MVYEVNAKPLTYDELMEMLDFLTKFGYFNEAAHDKACDGTAKVGSSETFVDYYIFYLRSYR